MNENQTKIHGVCVGSLSLKSIFFSDKLAIFFFFNSYILKFSSPKHTWNCKEKKNKKEKLLFKFFIKRHTHIKNETSLIKFVSFPNPVNFLPWIFLYKTRKFQELRVSTCFCIFLLNKRDVSHQIILQMYSDFYVVVHKIFWQLT